MSGSDIPDWMTGLAGAAAGLDAGIFRRGGGRPGQDARAAAVLMLFGEDGLGPDTGPDVLLLRRADTLGSHPGQVAFPGGSADPGDNGPVGTALREATEEVGLDAAGVTPLTTLPNLYVPVSRFDVTPVLAYWRRPSAVRAVDAAETAAVARVPVSRLADPENRIQVTHPSGFESPAYLLPGMLVWGFTAGLLTVLLSIGGWDRPWDTERRLDLDTAWRAVEDLRVESNVDNGSRRTGPGDGNLPPASAEVEA
jgi:8-oxo-dGTP pyrophosphatase MutT (NUDIX family)